MGGGWWKAVDVWRWIAVGDVEWSDHGHRMRGRGDASRPFDISAGRRPTIIFHNSISFS